jgi:hypothetical protein
MIFPNTQPSTPPGTNDHTSLTGTTAQPGPRERLRLFRDDEPGTSPRYADANAMVRVTTTHSGTALGARLRALSAEQDQAHASAVGAISQAALTEPSLFDLDIPFELLLRPQSAQQPLTSLTATRFGLGMGSGPDSPTQAGSGLDSWTASGSALAAAVAASVGQQPSPTYVPRPAVNPVSSIEVDQTPLQTESFQTEPYQTEPYQTEPYQTEQRNGPTEPELLLRRRRRARIIGGVVVANLLVGGIVLATTRPDNNPPDNTPPQGNASTTTSAATTAATTAAIPVSTVQSGVSVAPLTPTTAVAGAPATTSVSTDTVVGPEANSASVGSELLGQDPFFTDGIVAETTHGES